MRESGRVDEELEKSFQNLIETMAFLPVGQNEPAEILDRILVVAQIGAVLRRSKKGLNWAKLLDVTLDPVRVFLGTGRRSGSFPPD